MALIECNECKKIISDKAAACSGCGAPIEVAKATAAVNSKPTPPIFSTFTKVFLAFVAVLIFVSWMNVSHIMSESPSPTQGAVVAQPEKPKKTPEQMKKDANQMIAILGAQSLKDSMRNPASFKLETLT